MEERTDGSAEGTLCRKATHSLYHFLCTSRPRADPSHFWAFMSQNDRQVGSQLCPSVGQGEAAPLLAASGNIMGLPNFLSGGHCYQRKMAMPTRKLIGWDRRAMCREARVSSFHPGFQGLGQQGYLYTLTEEGPSFSISHSP